MYTVVELQNLFNKFNSCYFNNELPVITIKLCSAKSYAGIFILPRGTKKPAHIKISTFYDYPNIEIENTLIHEMVHLWQYINNYKDSHGESFKKKAIEINKIGIHTVEIGVDISTYSIDKKCIKPEYIAYWEVNSDNVRFCKVRSLSALITLKNHLKNKFEGIKVKTCLIKNENVTNCSSGRGRYLYYSVNIPTWEYIYKPTIVKHIK